MKRIDSTYNIRVVLLCFLKIVEPEITLKGSSSEESVLAEKREILENLGTWGLDGSFIKICLRLLEYYTLKNIAIVVNNKYIWPLIFELFDLDI